MRSAASRGARPCHSPGSSRDVLNVLGLRAEDLLPVAGASQAVGDGALNGVLLSATLSRPLDRRASRSRFLYTWSGSGAVGRFRSFRRL